MLKPGARVKFVAGLFEGSYGVVVLDEEGIAEDGELCVAFEVFGTPGTRCVAADEVVDVSLVVTPIAEIEAAVRDAVGRRGFNQRAFGWWVERASASTAASADLEALDAAEREFCERLTAERATAERAALAEVHAALAGLDERAREEVWWARRSEWTAWRDAVPKIEWSEEQIEAARALRDAVDQHRCEHALDADRDELLRNEALEAMIEAEPDADPPRLVYADWLVEAGDPRGELMQREARGESVPRKAFLGALAPFEASLAATWRLGFLASARVEATRSDEQAGISVSRLLARVLALPTARALRELTVFLPSVHEQDEDVIAALTARVRPTLRALTLATNEAEEMLSWTRVEDLGLLPTALPGLEALSVRAGRLTLSAAEFPSLRRLSIETVGMDAAHLATIARASWPRLEALTLWCGSASYGVHVRAEDFEELLTRCELPSLRALDLSNNEVTDALAELVVASPLLPRLSSLTLSKGTMTAAGARVLVDNAARLRHLELDLTENYLDGESVAALEAALPRVRLGEQREAEEYEGALYRYAAVGE